MKHLLISPEGDSFPATPAALQRRLGLDAGSGVISRAVRDLGFIELRYRDNRLLITGRPRVISPLAVAGLGQKVARWRVGRVGLSVLDDGWSTSVHASVAGAIARLRRLCRELSIDPGWSLFDATPLRLDELDGEGYAQMHLLSAEWQTLGGEMDCDMRRRLLSRAGAVNIFVARPSSDSESVVIEYSRVLERPWTSSWMHRAGIDLRNQPDRRYIAWVTRAYRDALATGRPRLERIRAELHCPERGTRLFDYDRLILPWRTPQNEPIATGVSIVRRVAALGLV
ncbi:MAG: hypothetical protein IRZ04_02320 [Rhodospirillales bacterium]|nr:hypothetical protein [Rhodospirillales bacterium]